MSWAAKQPKGFSKTNLAKTSQLQGDSVVTSWGPWGFAVWDDKLPGSYRDYFISQDKDPEEPISIRECQTGFERCSVDLVWFGSTPHPGCWLVTTSDDITFLVYLDRSKV